MDFISDSSEIKFTVGGIINQQNLAGELQFLAVLFIQFRNCPANNFFAPQSVLIFLEIGIYGNRVVF